MAKKKYTPFSPLDIRDLRFYDVIYDGWHYVMVQLYREGMKHSIPYRTVMPVAFNFGWDCDGLIDVFRTEKARSSDSVDESIVSEVTMSFDSYRDRIIRDVLGNAITYPDGGILTSNKKFLVDVIKPMANPFARLDDFVGCENIRRHILDVKALSDYNRMMSARIPGFQGMNIFLHSIFYGNPGTGKTTFCKLYASLLFECGLLSKGHVVVTDRNTFSGEAFGEEETIVSQLLDMSQGGILMIDEVYLLDGVHHEDPNKMVLPLLLNHLANEDRKDFALVLCGYKEKIDKMLDQNPGLSSRIVNRFEFTDFTIDQLMTIGERFLWQHGHTFTDAGRSAFRKEVETAKAACCNATWGNARYVKSLVEKVYTRHAVRCMSSGCCEPMITAEDIVPQYYERKRKNTIRGFHI